MYHCRIRRGFRGSRAGILLIAVLVAALGPLACDHSQLVAPQGASITTSVSPLTIAAGGDTSTLSVLVRQQDGSFVDDETQVSVAASNGVLCAVNPSELAASHCSVWPSILVLQTNQGIATAFVRSTAAPGSITLTVQSGSASATATITASATVLGDGGKIVTQAEHDSIAVQAADHLMLFLANADGSQAADGTRVVITADTSLVLLSRTIAITHDGFVETTLTGVKSGTVVVSISSGSVHTQKTIVIS